jgi:fucose permease
MVAWGLFAGLGAGAIDAGINAHAAARFPPRLMSWLHASWGVGAALGPLVMTAVLTAGLAWQWGYALVGLTLAVMALCFWRTLELWDASTIRAQAVPQHAGLIRTLTEPVVVVQVLVFLIYTGLEATAGQWAYTLLTEGRGMPAATAGVWTAGYWGSLTAGRVVSGLIAPRISTTSLLRLCMSSAPVWALLVRSDDSQLAALGLALLGFSLAPIFPLLISVTPTRLGQAQAVHAIGFQVSAACLGAAALPGAAGLLARWRGLDSIGTFLVAGTLVLLVLHEAVLAVARRSQRPSDLWAGR